MSTARPPRSPTDSVGTLDELAQALAYESIAVQKVPPTLYFATLFGIAAPMWVRWVARDRLVLISQTLPLLITQPAHVAPMALGVARINQELDMVGLVFDPDRGTLCLRTHLFLSSRGQLDYPLLLTVLGRASRSHSSGSVSCM